MSKTIVGIEITEESVQAVEVKQGRTPVIIAAGEVTLPPGAARDSEVIDQQAVTLAIKQLWQKARIRSRNVVLGVGSRRVLVREHTMPKLSPEAMKKALPYQVDDLLPVPVDQAVLDFYPISETNGNVNGLLVAAVAEPVEALVNTLRAAKLKTTSVDLLPFALSRVATRLVGREETVAMVYLGSHTSYIVIISAGIPVLVRIISVDLLPPPPVTRPDISSETTRRQRREASSPEHRAAINDMATRVRGTLQFYASRADAQPVTRVLLSGAGVLQDDARSILNETLGIQSEVVSVQAAAKREVNLEGDLPIVLTSTLGLALGRSGR
jgi:type IV pilus assembly protein PilM